ncbi:MAG: hypothetical protein LBP61_03985, partial [Desulfovibrio sp.]|nr:hypothetical protein [Desulfovibrio sp.]
MPCLAFAKILPGGNTTILLPDCGLEQKELSRLSALLMNRLHLGAEQVGALSTGGTLPHLQMMGGEFCVNATRSAALLLARAGRLRPVGEENCLGGQITVSGSLAPVDILVNAEEAPLLKALSPDGRARQTARADLPPAGETRLFCAARMICGAGST